MTQNVSSTYPFQILGGKLGCKCQTLKHFHINIGYTEKTKCALLTPKWVSNWCLQFWHDYTYAKSCVCVNNNTCGCQNRGCQVTVVQCYLVWMLERKCVKLHADHDPTCSPWTLEPCSLKSHEIHKQTIFSPMNRLYWIQNIKRHNDLRSKWQKLFTKR